MYTLLSGAYKQWNRVNEYYVMMIGMDNAGKTTLVEQLKHKYLAKYRAVDPRKINPTIGLNVARLNLQGIRTIIWDLGGQEDLHSIWKKYYKEAHCLVYIVDANDDQKLMSSKIAFQKTMNDEQLRGIPLMILVNKVDEPGSKSVSEIMEFLGADKGPDGIVGYRTMECFPISALSGDGVNDGMNWLANVLKQNFRMPIGFDEYT